VIIHNMIVEEEHDDSVSFRSKSTPWMIFHTSSTSVSPSPLSILEVLINSHIV
jgi:hypothetical protein